MQTRSRLVVAQVWGWEWGLPVNGPKRSYRGDENVQKLDYGDGCATGRFTKIH